MKLFSYLFLNVILLLQVLGYASGLVTRHGLNKRLMGGIVVDSTRDMPFDASILIDRENIPVHCGGVIISATHILTSSVCVTTPGGKTYQPGNITVTHYLESNKGTVINAVKIFADPKFMENDKINYSLDVAIIEVQSMQGFTNSKRAIIDKDKLEAGEKVIITGRAKDDQGDITDSLQMVEQVLGDIDTCKKEVSEFDDHNGSSICILGKDNLEKGTCYWDQGYGLYTEKDNRYYLHGFMGANSLVSEKTCGTKDAKTVYINVLSKMDFIKDNCYLTERYLTDATVA